MVKAIIFDCFGVLTTESWLLFKRRQFGVDTEAIEQVDSLSKQRDAGLIDYEDFYRGVAKVGKTTPEKIREACENTVVNKDVFNMIEKTLKPQYKIGLLSNAGANKLAQLFGSERLALFDAVALSYETGYVKPDERAYQKIAERLGVTPEECIFVDDQERYCTAAKEQGMQAICYENFADFKAEIITLLKKC